MPHGSDDARKRFILATTGNFYGIEPSSSLAGSQELNNFLDDGNQFVLSVVRHDGNLHLSNTVTDAQGLSERTVCNVAVKGCIFVSCREINKGHLFT